MLNKEDGRSWYSSSSGIEIKITGHEHDVNGKVIYRGDMCLIHANEDKLWEHDWEVMLKDVLLVPNYLFNEINSKLQTIKKYKKRDYKCSQKFFDGTVKEMLKTIYFHHHPYEGVNYSKDIHYFLKGNAQGEKK